MMLPRPTTLIVWMMICLAAHLSEQKVTPRPQVNSALKLGMVFSRKSTGFFSGVRYRILLDLSFSSWTKNIQDIRSLMQDILPTRTGNQAHHENSVSTDFRILQSKLNSLVASVYNLQSMSFSEGGAIKKRAIIPILGEAIKYVFGNPSASDLTEINAHFTNVDATERKTLHVLSLHATLINSSHELAVDNSRKIDRLYQSIDRSKVLLNLLAKNYEKDMSDIQYTIQSDLLASANIRGIISVVDGLQLILRDYEEALRLAAKGQLSGHLVSANDLLEVLQHVQGSEAEMTLPFEATRANLPRFYHIARVILTHVSGGMRAFVEIPLLNAGSKFEIYKTHAFPSRNFDLNVFDYIVPSSEYLAVSDDGGRFIELSDLTMCQGDDPMFCDPTHPIRHASSQTMSCDYLVFTGNLERIQEVCVLRVVHSFEPILIRASSEDTWMFSVPESNQLLIDCARKPEVQTISGVGYLKLEKGCSVNANKFELLSHSVHSTNQVEKFPDHGSLTNRSLIFTANQENKPLPNDTLIRYLLEDQSNNTLDNTGMLRTRFDSKLVEFSSKMEAENKARQELKSLTENNSWHTPFMGQSLTLDTVFSMFSLVLGLSIVYVIWRNRSRFRNLMFPTNQPIVEQIATPQNIQNIPMLPLKRKRPPIPVRQQVDRELGEGGGYATVSHVMSEIPNTGIGIIPP